LLHQQVTTDYDWKNSFKKFFPGFDQASGHVDIGVSGGIAPCILNFSMEVCDQLRTPTALSRRKVSLLPVDYEAGWGLEPSGRCGEKKKSLSPLPGIEKRNFIWLMCFNVDS